MIVDAKILTVLNQIYKEILNRPVDEDGIKQYSKYIPFKENFVRKSLLKSDEYLILTGVKDKPIAKKYNYTPTYYHIDGINFTYKQTDTSSKKILVLSLVNNCIKNNTLVTIKNFIKELSDNFKYVKCGILTNNNIDKTLDQLLEWQLNDRNILIQEYKNEIISVIENNSCGNKIYKLAEYREFLLKQSLEYFGTNFDYIIVFDSDIIFDPSKLTSKIIESISIPVEWSAISANNCFYNSNIHYDILALRLQNQDIDIQKIYPDFLNYYGKTYEWNNNLYIFNNFVEVKSAFGAMTIYNAKEIVDLVKNNKCIYNISELPKCTCEHIGLDIQLKNKHYINSSMKLPSNTQENDNMYSKSLIFLPRDAGFFSVFNFLIGVMSIGIKAYPYFNKELFIKYRKTNQHFCYWTQNDNSWFDYFDPIYYYENDTEHKDKTFLSYPISGGEEAPEEFRVPKIFKNLLINKDKTEFQHWRNNIHNVYKQYIKFNPILEKESDRIFYSFFKPTEYVIGLHYRHPSHSIESGMIFLQQYYEKIDSIFNDHPNAKIFLATDTEFGLASFKYKYGDKLHYIPKIDRLPIDNILEWTYAMSNHKNIDITGMIDGKGYELHHQTITDNNDNYYEFTKNLLVEVLCLSKCNILVNSTSNISLALSYINPLIPIVTI